MARKRAGDLLNILSDPENRDGLVSGPSPVALPKMNRGASKFPGIVGLGAVTGTGVPPVQRRALLGDDDEARPRAFRMDLALAGLLGLLVTNIVSFTLGARAGRQSVDPSELTALQPSAVATTVVVETTPPTTAATPAAPTPVPSEPFGSAPILNAEAPAPGGPGTPVATAPAAPAPAPVAAPAPAGIDTSDEAMAGKFVVRCITLPYDERGKKIAEKICGFIEGQGLGPALVRPVRGKLVVEAGKHARYDDAKAAQNKIRGLKQGFNSFDTAYVIQRATR